MKKLKLRALDFEGAELLTKEQLKKILGGGMMGTVPGGTDPTTNPIGSPCADTEHECSYDDPDCPSGTALYCAPNGLDCDVSSGPEGWCA